jgi:hypothetical protein
MLRVVTDKSKRTASGQGVVVIEGDNPEEVSEVEAKEMAINHATTVLGFRRPGLGLGGGSYPVDGLGDDSDPIAAANDPGRHWRRDYEINDSPV